MKIATLTLNPALDRTMYFGKDVKFGALNRAVAPSLTTHGGKGTNVSCVFKILGIESTAYGFIGGDNGDLFLKLLEPYDIKTDFTRTKCDTRMNFKIISGDGEPTEFNESGGPIDLIEKEDILNKIKNVIDKVDFFFMGGSVPPGVEKSIYRDIINLGGDRTKFFVDCDGEALKLCMSNDKKPFIIKPNQFELEQFCGKKFDLDNNFDVELEEVKKEVKKIYDDTGVTVLCTLGEYGGLYCGNDGIYYVKSPKVEVKGFTGAGDTFLTAFVAAWFGLVDDDLDTAPPVLRTPPSNRTYGAEGGFRAEKALLFAVAASSAKVTKPGTEFATVGEVVEMFGRMVGEYNV
jgi:1-phosphofructokinase